MRTLKNIKLQQKFATNVLKVNQFNSIPPIKERHVLLQNYNALNLSLTWTTGMHKDYEKTDITKRMNAKSMLRSLHFFLPIFRISKKTRMDRKEFTSHFLYAYVYKYSKSKLLLPYYVLSA